MLGQPAPAAEADAAWVIEVNLDDTTAEVVGHTIAQFLAAGALDAWAAPIQMKKSRPGWMLCAIVQDESLRRAEENPLPRDHHLRHPPPPRRADQARARMRAVETPFGPVRVKVGTREGKLVTASPEYEDCRRIALEKNVPLREVMDAARRAFDGERRTSNVERPTSKC